MEQPEEEITIQKTIVDHAHDEQAKLNYELLEMKRLGLPISFTGSFKKGNKRSRIEDFDGDDLGDNNIRLTPVIVPELVTQISTINIDSNLSNAQMEQDETIEPSMEGIVSKPAFKSKSKIRKHRKGKKGKKCTGSRSVAMYWNQRYVLFSLFNRGIKLDHESWYSVTPEPIARHIAQRMQRALNLKRQSSSGPGLVIMDGFCGAGGNIIQFALLPSVHLVYAVDISAEKLALAQNNASVYGCAHKIQFVQADFLSLIQGEAGKRFASTVDACFLSPPWGGPEYRSMSKYSLDAMTPNGLHIARCVGDNLTKNIAFLLPRNFDQNQLEPLTRAIYGGEDSNKDLQVELEENRVFSKVKMMTAYFGELVLQTSHHNPL